MLCKATVNVAGLGVDELVDVDPTDDVIAGYLRARLLVPVDHQPMPDSAKPAGGRKNVTQAGSEASSEPATASA